MRRLVFLVLVLAACGESVERVEPTRLRILAGDGQVAPVVTGEPGLAAQVENVLPDTLIARLEGDTTTASASITATDPLMASAVSFPSSTVVEYVVPQEGCGRPFIASMVPDSAGEVRTLWERPAGALPDLAWQGDVWGALCEMEARAKVGTEFRAETTFVATFTPGPPDDAFQVGSPSATEENIGRLHPRAVSDEFGNPVPWILSADCCITTGGTIEDFPSFRTFAPSEVGTGTVRVILQDGSVWATGTVETAFAEHVGGLEAVIRF